MSQAAAIALYSGGLDSILACRLIMAQGIRVVAVKFVTPFFDDYLLGRAAEFQAEVLRKYGIDVRVHDLGEGYVQLLANPRHGYGKHFNPCIDCKILMLRTARELLAEHGASFLISGEVLGQRPMSQRRDTLRVIEKESGCESILLRPLCARHLPETTPELEGLVRRSELCAFRGRGRLDQIQLAARFGITDYPAPAGGCMLTDPNLAGRIAGFYQDRERMNGAGLRVNDIRLLLVGRQFHLPGGHWLVLGRNEQENERIAALAGAGDWLLTMTTRSGPTGLLRTPPGTGAGSGGDAALLAQAASMVVRYGRKIKGQPAAAEVLAVSGGEQRTLAAQPLTDEACMGWQR